MRSSNDRIVDGAMFGKGDLERSPFLVVSAMLIFGKSTNAGSDGE